MLLTQTNYSIFKHNNRIEICFFIYQIQSIVFMQTTVADLLHNKTISRRIAWPSASFKTVYACANEAGVDKLGVRNFSRYKSKVSLSFMKKLKLKRNGLVAK